MGNRLVIVESPAKGRTINKYLGKGYVVRASMGHIRDLPRSAAEIPASVKKEPWARLGVDIANGFRPLYVIPEDKKKHVRELKEELKNADELLLATDEDREGESISWHLVQELKPNIPVKRMVFHEITKEAILAALEQTRDIDQSLVQAQETRRIVDRLFGYEVSPVLWKKVRPKLSAGRVQSVAIRLLVDREKERMAFREASYWDLAGRFEVEKGSFDATLAELGGRRIASGRDFDPATGRLRPEAAVAVLDGASARGLCDGLRGVPFRVLSVEDKPFTQRPAPPFTTSTLQQEGGRKLGWAARRTMQVAQSLYENGYITYMRTDSTTLSAQAVEAARAQVLDLYGPSFLPDRPRTYATKVKNAQEAHEAIRPSGDRFRTPRDVHGELDFDQRRLYELIWKRTVASQMADASGVRVVARLGAKAADGREAVFQASGKTITLWGYLRAYVEGSDDPNAELGDQESVLPPMRPGDPARAHALAAKEHRTQPPPRLTEAALVKALEQDGIGRPSTYASIIDTIERRDYTFKKGNTLVPTWVAFAVVNLLEEHFPDLVDLAYTARMEDDLDAISRGEGQSAEYLRSFYFGNGAEGATAGGTASATSADGDSIGLHRQLKEKLDEIDPRVVCTVRLGADVEGREVTVRVGRFGPYLERGESRANLPDGLAPDELTMEKATELLDRPQGPRELGRHPESGDPIYVREGRFGPYVQQGEVKDGEPKPKSVSLLRGMSPETLTIEQALALLSMPRTVGQDPAGIDVIVSTGRFGPFVKRGTDTRSLGPDDDPLTIGLEKALILLAQEKKGGRRMRAQVEPIRVIEGVAALGGAAVKVMPGRFGPYVTDGETNASLPRGVAPENVTGEEAAQLILDRRARGPSPKKGARRKAATSKRAGKLAADGAPAPAAARKAAPKKKATSAKKAKKASKASKAAGTKPAAS